MASRLFEAMYDGECAWGMEDIAEGDLVSMTDDGVICQDCYETR